MDWIVLKFSELILPVPIKSIQLFFCQNRTVFLQCVRLWTFKWIIRHINQIQWNNTDNKIIAPAAVLRLFKIFKIQLIIIMTTAIIISCFLPVVRINLYSLKFCIVTWFNLLLYCRIFHKLIEFRCISTWTQREILQKVLLSISLRAIIKVLYIHHTVSASHRCIIHVCSRDLSHPCRSRWIIDLLHNNPLNLPNSPDYSRLQKTVVCNPAWQKAYCDTFLLTAGVPKA